jgi:hypothetical protein
MKTKSNKNIFLVIGTILMFAALWLTSEDEVNSINHYCENVLDGTWPNYKEIDCERDTGL